MATPYSTPGERHATVEDEDIEALEELETQTRPSTSAQHMANFAIVESSKGKGKERRVERKKDHSLQKLLLYEEREAKHLRQILTENVRRLEAEMDKNKDADSRIQIVTARMKELDLERHAALAEASHSKERLRVFEVQFENLKRELERAQTEYNNMALMRDAADGLVSKMKQELRQMKTERLVDETRNKALQEGIDEGFRRGLEQGMQEGIEEGRLIERRKATAAFQQAIRERDRGTGSGPAEEYFRAPPSSTIRSRVPTRNFSRSTFRSAADASNARPRGVPAVAASVADTDNGGGVMSPTAPRSIQNGPPSPMTFHSANIPDGYIPVTEGDGRINLPPPHEVQPNRALSPSPSAATLSEMGTSSRVENGLDREQESTNPRRSIFNRSTAPSPGLSIIPEGSGLEGSSPEVSRRRELERAAQTPSIKQWSTVNNDWADQPDDRSRLRDALRYSDPRVAEDHSSLREETRSYSSRNGPPRSRPVPTMPSPLAPTPERPFDPVSEGINAQILRNGGSLSPFNGAQGVLSSPAQSQRQINNESRFGISSPVPSVHGRFHSLADPLPQISIETPSREESYTSGNESHHSAISREPSPGMINRPLSRQSNASARHSFHGNPPVFSQGIVGSDQAGFFEASGPPIPEAFDVEETNRPHSPFLDGSSSRRTVTPAQVPPALYGHEFASRSRTASPAGTMHSASNQNRSRIGMASPAHPFELSDSSSSASPPTRILPPGHFPTAATPNINPNPLRPVSRNSTSSSITQSQGTHLRRYKSMGASSSAISRGSLVEPAPTMFPAYNDPPQATAGPSARPKSILRNPLTPTMQNNALLSGGQPSANSILKSPALSVRSHISRQYETAPDTMNYPPPLGESNPPRITPLINSRPLSEVSAAPRSSVYGHNPIAVTERPISRVLSPIPQLGVGPALGGLSRPASRGSNIPGSPNYMPAEDNLSYPHPLTVGSRIPNMGVPPLEPQRNGVFPLVPSSRSRSPMLGGSLLNTTNAAAVPLPMTPNMPVSAQHSPYVPAVVDEPGGVALPTSLTDRWLGMSLPPSAADGQRTLPSSSGPSVRQTPWHPSQHLAGSATGSPGVDRVRNGLPAYSGPMSRPMGIR